ncbi:MAG: hypothetical protein PVJ01_00765 [Pseudomonadota bacterium]
MDQVFFIWIAVAAAVGLSAIADRSRTVEGIRRGMAMLRSLLPQFLLLVVLVSVLLGVLSRDTLALLLGRESGVLGVLIAAGVGSVALIPGPIAFPLAGMLLERGVGYTVLAVFITTLMMVGVVTFPVEKHYLGTRTALMRNFLSLAGALVVGMIMGVLL